MRAAILTYLKTTAGKHILAIALVIGGVIVGRAWLQEHDARLQSDAAVKVAQTQIADLQAQKTAVAQAAQVQVVTLQKAAAAIQTAPAAIAAVPSVTPTATASNPAPELDATPIEGTDKASVNAVPLYEDLNACKQNEVKLNSCSLQLDLQTKIDAQKDAEVVALKKKPGFWHQVGSVAKQVAIGVAIGYVLHK